MHTYTVICLWPDEIRDKWSSKVITAGSIKLQQKNIVHSFPALRMFPPTLELEEDALMINISHCDISLKITSVHSSECDNVPNGESRKKTYYINYQKYFVHRHNAMFAELIMQELKSSLIFQQNFIQFVRHHWNHKTYRQLNEELPVSDTRLSNLVLIILQWPNQHILDYKWNYRLCELVVRAIQLAYAMNWLNTLGGGYSALGDYSRHHAEHAGKISCRQLRLALEMGDPNTVIRCHLYYALSLMQIGKLRESKYMIRKCYRKTLSLIVRDHQLLAMCKGIWSRLKYKYTQKKKAGTNT